MPKKQATSSAISAAASSTPEAENKSLFSQFKDAASSGFQFIVASVQIVKNRPLEYAQRSIGIVYVLIASFMVWKTIMVLANTPSPVVVVLSGSMEPAFHRGDILVLTNISPPIAGDVVVYKLEGRDIPIVHRIISIHRNETGSFVLTKGDNNFVDDRGLYAEDQNWLMDKDILGKASGFLPHVGMITIWLNDYPVVKYSLLLGTIFLMMLGYS